MADGNCCHGQDGDEILDSPIVGNERREGKDDHAGNTDHSE